MSDERETYWLRTLRKALGYATHPDDYKASVRDVMWADLLKVVAERDAEIRRAHDNGWSAGYQRGRESNTTDQRATGREREQG